MIDVKELKINNWVNGSYNGFSKNVKIFSFDHVDIQHTDDKQTPYPIFCFSPIILTEELLLKNEFHKDVRFYMRKDLHFKLFNSSFDNKGFKFFAIIEADKNIITAISKRIEYVHQLQNICTDLAEIDVVNNC